MTEPPQIVQTVRYVQDIILQIMADQLLHDDNARMSMTVIADGKLVTGDVIPRNAWLHLLQQMMPNDNAVVMIENIDLALRHVDAQLEEEATEDNPPHAGYLNFENAQVDGTDVGLFRVALSSVTGWTLGFRR